MSAPLSVLTGFIYMSWLEFKYLTLRKNKLSYLIFILIFMISIYGIAIQEFSGEVMQDTGIIGGLKSGESPLIDILIFMYIFGIGSIEAVQKGTTPEMTIPAELGITLILIVPFLLAVNMVSRLAVRSAASSISREKEDRTLYLAGSTHNTRPAIYLAKLAGAFLTALPMVVVMVLGVFLASGSMVFGMPDAVQMQAQFNELVINMVILTLSTVALFTSLGTLVSVLKRNEESAVSLSSKFTTLAGVLTTLWIMLPIFSVAGENISSVIETLTMVSPITLDIMALYEGTNVVLYAGAQLLAAAVLAILGIIVFIKQDIEY